MYRMRVTGTYAAQYGRYASLADLLRQIGHDERVHKLDSLASMRAPRLGQPLTGNADTA
jgi:ubiquinol oxidase